MMRRLKASMVISCSVLVIRLLALPAGADPKETPPGQEKKAEVVMQVPGQTGTPASPAGKANGPNKDNDGDAGSDPVLVTEDNDTNDSGTPNNVADDGDNAHPSGKDKSVEHGNGAKNPNQGKSEADPDNDGKGPDRAADPAASGKGNKGPDKPGGKGGHDQADQDGNNGCGNDDDFEDDNEGRCGHKPKGPKSSSGACNGNVPAGKNKHCPSGGGETPSKVTICHATGSSTNPYVTITVSHNALKGHGKHSSDIIPVPTGGCPGGDHPGSKKVTICHATGSERNPYVMITVDENALNGHDGHSGDIVPAPSSGCPTGSGGSDPADPGDDGDPHPKGPKDPKDPKDEVAGPGVKPEVKADDVSRERPPSVDPVTLTPGPTGRLPFTGGEVIDFILLALAGIVTGLILIWWGEMAD